MTTYSVFSWDLDETETANTTLQECRNSIAGHFEKNPDAGCFIIVDDKSTAVEEWWYWCETCGVYKTEHCRCVAAEIWCKANGVR